MLGLTPFHVPQPDNRFIRQSHVDDVMNVLDEEAHVDGIRLAHQRRAIEAVVLLDELGRFDCAVEASQESGIDIRQRERQTIHLRGPRRQTLFFRLALRLFLFHRILEDLEGIETRVIVLSIEDSLDRPPINVDLLGQRVELSFAAQFAQPCTQALEIIHGVAVDTRKVFDGVILDIYASRCKANMTCLTR